MSLRNWTLFNYIYKMKNIFFIPFLLLAFLCSSQSHNKSTITITAIGGLTSGKVQDNFDCLDCDDKLNYKFSSGTYGLNFQYGVNIKFSVGLNISYGSYLLTRRNLEVTDFENFQSILGLAQTMELFTGAIEARYYVLNEKDYNIFLGPSIGFSSANDKFAGFDFSTKRSLSVQGLNYGFKGGINYFLYNNIGIVLHASYEGALLSGDSNQENEKNSLKRNISGFNILTGFILKI